MLIGGKELISQGEELKMIYDQVELVYKEKILGTDEDQGTEIDSIAFSDMQFPEETLSQMLHFLLERMQKNVLKTLTFENIQTFVDL